MWMCLKTICNAAISPCHRIGLLEGKQNAGKPWIFWEKNSVSCTPSNHSSDHGYNVVPQFVSFWLN